MSSSRLFWILAGLNLIWAPTNCFFKIAQRDASPAALVVIRWTLFAVLLWMALALPSTRRVLKPQFPVGWDRLKAFLIGLCCVSMSYILYGVALQKTVSIEANLLMTSYPVVMGLLAHFFLSERVSGRRWFAIVLGVAGTYAVLVGFTVPDLKNEHIQGNLLFFAGLLLECIALTMATRLVLRSSGLGVLAFESTGSAVGCLLYSLAFPVAFPLSVSFLSPATIAIMAYLALMAGVFAFGVWYVLVEKAPVSLMMLSTLIQPPVAALFGVWLLGEVVKANVFYGSAVIAAALIISASERRPSPQVPPLQPLENLQSS